MPRTDRRRPGLRWELTALVTAIMLGAMAVIFLVVYAGTATEIRRQIDRDAAGDTSQLAQALAGAARGGADTLAAARAYLVAQPYGLNPSLLFVSVPGTGAVFNDPEIVSAPRIDSRDTPAGGSVERGLAQRLLAPRVGFTEQRVPDVGLMRILERRVKIGSVKVIVGAGEPLAIVERAQHGVAQTFVLAGLITLALALAAGYFAGARMSAPLRRMAGVAARVDAGELEPRMDATRGSGEVAVLADAFNNMLDRLTGELKGQREFIADASHELRTPITVIRGQIEVLAAEPDPSPEDVRRVAAHVEREILRISRLVDDLLLLAQAEHRGFLRLERVELDTFVEQLWDGISLTAQRRFELGPVPAGVVLADPDRLAQALRNLAGNAICHTREPEGLVRLEVDVPAPTQLRFTIIDDGPGIPEAERERVFERFHRTDPARSRAAGGAGLGLAIVRAIADAHHGHVRTAAPARGRGARLELTLPGFEPAPARATPPPARAPVL